MVSLFFIIFENPFFPIIQGRITGLESPLVLFQIFHILRFQNWIIIFFHNLTLKNFLFTRMKVRAKDASQNFLEETTKKYTSISKPRSYEKNRLKPTTHESFCQTRALSICLIKIQLISNSIRWKAGSAKFSKNPVLQKFSRGN